MSIATEPTNNACSVKEPRDPTSFSFRIDFSMTPHGYKHPAKIFLFCDKHTNYKARLSNGTVTDSTC